MLQIMAANRPISGGMRVVIQHKTSFRYVRAEDDWTDDALMARNFERIRNAAEFCRQHNLRQAYIVAGDFDATGHRFNSATKTMLDVGQLRVRLDT